ncbi:MAG: AI-2E family transporter, partial [Chthoniobacteraceae bacterium]
MNPPEFPTPWQRKTIWTALATVAVATILALSVGFIYLFSQVMAFLQPILVPFAIAGVLAYLLEPVVARLVALGTTRHRAVAAVFVVTSLAFVGVMFWIIPLVSGQTAKLARRVPEITLRVRGGLATFALEVKEKYGLQLVPNELIEVAKPPPKSAPAPKPTEPEKPAAEQPPPSPSVPAVPPGAAPTAATPPAAPDAKSAAPPPAPKAPAPPTPETSNPEEVLRHLGSGEWLPRPARLATKSVTRHRPKSQPTRFSSASCVAKRA